MKLKEGDIVWVIVDSDNKTKTIINDNSFNYIQPEKGIVTKINKLTNEDKTFISLTLIDKPESECIKIIIITSDKTVIFLNEKDAWLSYKEEIKNFLTILDCFTIKLRREYLLTLNKTTIKIHREDYDDWADD